MSKRIGILTSGGDCPGLNAAIRGVCKAGMDQYGLEFIGFRNGFRGLVEDRSLPIKKNMLSNILTLGGTFLGTSRDKPQRMVIDGETRDMTDTAVAVYRRHKLDALVCLGGGGTQKNALRLHRAGLNIITLPKTIDNDVVETDKCFGFDTAVSIATEAIDRLHSTAMSHDRIIVVEIMGHRAGWLALGSGLAGGADIILIPELPYELGIVADAILRRKAQGKAFSIVVVAEGAMSRTEAQTMDILATSKREAKTKAQKQAASAELRRFHEQHVSHTVDLTGQLEELTGIESRLTILGHLQRGGTPSATDRILATQLGVACADCLHDKQYGVMIASHGDGAERVPLEKVAGKTRLVPPNHPWTLAARKVDTCLGIPD
ncbi:MAG: 6-phosphofructokinase [Fidelibacterota bacterium]